MKPLMVVFLIMLVAPAACFAMSRQGRTQNESSRQQPAIPSLSPAEATAKSDLDRMAAALNAADGIAYDASIQYDGGQPQLSVATVAATIERGGRVLIQTTINGKQEGTIAETGRQFLLYDAASNSYVQVKTSPDVFSFEQALQLAGAEIYPKPTPACLDLRAAIGFPIIFLNGCYDGQPPSYSVTPGSPMDGKSVIQVTQSVSSPTYGTINATYIIDTATYLPVGFTQIDIQPGKAPETVMHALFTNLTVINTPLPASTYIFSIPTNAKLVTSTRQ